MVKLFVSYSRRDSDFTSQLAARLDADPQFDVWIDFDDIKGGDAWMTSIAQGIAGCQAFVLVLSPPAVESRHVRQEVTLAFSDEKKIVPLRWRRYELPDDLRYQLGGLNYIDFSDGDFEGGFAKLVASLRGQQVPAQTIPQQPFPPAQQAGGFHPAGRWQVQLQSPFPGGNATGEYMFLPSGIFTGRLTNHLGLAYAEGIWQWAGNQLHVQGRWAPLAQPMNVQPYGFVLLIQQANQSMFGGMTSGNEKVTFTRMA